MILSVGKHLKWWAQSRIYILEMYITSVHKNSLNLSYLYLLELYVTCYVHMKGVKKECYATISAPK